MDNMINENNNFILNKYKLFKTIISNKNNIKEKSVLNENGIKKSISTKYKLNKVNDEINKISDIHIKNKKGYTHKLRKMCINTFVAISICGYISGQIFVPVFAKKKYEESSGVTEEYLQTDSKIPALYSKAAIVMDAKTGQILFQKNGYKKEYPASITKCMMALVALEHNNLDDVVTYSENAINSIEAGSSSVCLDYGEKLTVEQSLYGAMLESANECCNGLAEQTSGNIPAFVDLMNQKAASLGCKNTHFNNANGLFDKNHYTCCYDMALILKEAMKSEEWRKITGTVVYKVPKTNKMKETRLWRNHHSFVNTDIPYNSELFTVEGGKTGYTVKAKNTLVTYAKSNTSDMELICVVMRCNDYAYYNGHTFSRVYTDTNNLLKYGFSNFKNISAGVDVNGQNTETSQNTNYFTKMYQTLQPDKFISFSSENDCQILVSNTYDTSKLKGTLVFDKDNKTGRWGKYEFTSGDNVISSTDINYSINQDLMKELYKSNPMEKVLDMAKYVFYLIIILVMLLVIFILVKISQRISLISIFSRKRNSVKLSNSKLSFKPKRTKRLRRSKSDYGFIDSSSRRRRKRYSKKNKLHF